MRCTDQSRLSRLSASNLSSFFELSTICSHLIWSQAISPSIDSHQTSDRVHIQFRRYYRPTLHNGTTMVCNVTLPLHTHPNNTPCSPARQGYETPAYVLSFLTGAGGITGYLRTGSVPSVAAGLTVGALVRSLVLYLASHPPLSPSRPPPVHSHLLTPYI